MSSWLKDLLDPKELLDTLLGLGVLIGLAIMVFLAVGLLALAYVLVGLDSPAFEGLRP